MEKCSDIFLITGLSYPIVETMDDEELAVIIPDTFLFRDALASILIRRKNERARQVTLEKTQTNSKYNWSHIVGF